MCAKNIEKDDREFIRHYTNVYALVRILKGGFKFGQPREDWDDLNDVFTLNKYGEIKQKKVYIICFCSGLGYAHHWFYYGNRSNPLQYENCWDGIKCNIKLDKHKFEKLLISRGLELKSVKYAITNEEASKRKNHPKHDTLKQTLKSEEDLYLLKRSEYEIEKELRIVVLKDQNEEEPAPITDFMDCIEHISLLVDPESLVYRILERKLVWMYPQLKGKIKSSGVHKSQLWEKEIKKILKTT